MVGMAVYNGCNYINIFLIFFFFYWILFLLIETRSFAQPVIS